MFVTKSSVFGIGIQQQVIFDPSLNDVVDSMFARINRALLKTDGKATWIKSCGTMPRDGSKPSIGESVNARTRPRSVRRTVTKITR
jgi:hypothetical protein